jgi:hypothetical protein
VTPQELAAMQAARPEVSVTVEPTPGHPAFLTLKTLGGCPYLQRELDGKASCSIHDARPYQCRRFICGRPDPDTEPFEMGGPLGCRNLSDRLEQGYQFAAFYASNQRRAMVWAKSHGWPKGAR